VREGGSRVVSVLDSGAEGPGFKSAVATLSGNGLFTPTVPLFTKQQNWYRSSPLSESNGSLPSGL